MDSNSSGYDLSQDHPGYKLPVSNISYHIYPEKNRTSTDAVARRAFKRIMDSYDEYEKLTGVFQVELDRRQQQIKERKEREKALREERQRQVKEDKKNRRLGRINHTSNNGNSKALGPGSTAALLPSSRVSWHSYHPYRNLSSSQQNALTASIMDIGRGPFTHSTGSKRGLGHSLGSAASGSHSFSLQDQPPHLILGSTFTGERSSSNSPVLPLTPSPQLRAASESGVGLDLSNTERAEERNSGAVAVSMSGSSITTPFSHTGSTSSFLGTQQHHLGIQQQPFPMRKKRKQAIPVHPSIVNRIPGITLRIQPDTEQQLQVEILKNVDDYQPLSTANKPLRGTDINVDIEPMNGVVSEAHGEGDSRGNDSNSELQQELQAKQDMEKVLESIESGRPGYPFFPTAYLHQTLEMELQSRESTEMCDLTTASRRLPHQKHCRESSSGSVKSLELHDPTGARPLTNSATSLGWAEHQPLELVGPRVLLEEVVAARAKLPLSWDNFSTRDCQVNKVKFVGKQDKDFELLEEVLQEAIARQHAAHASSEDSDGGMNQNQPQGNERTYSRRTSHHQQDREESAASTSSPPAPLLSRPAATRASTKKLSTMTPPVTVPSRLAGIRATRGGTKDLVRGYDDIERILKEKRLKKRAEKQRQDSTSRASSQAADEDEDDIDDEGDELMPLHRRQEESGHESGDERGNRRQMSRRFRKTLNLAPTRQKTLMSTSPPSPPHSRQVTPFKGESTSTSRRQSTSRARPFLYVATGPGSDTSSTPPATPTRATATLPRLFGSSESTGQSSNGRNRMKSRSASSTVPPEGKNVFFDSALEQIEKKRKESIAKKKAAAAAAAAAPMISEVPDQQETKIEAEEPLTDLKVKSEAEPQTVGAADITVGELDFMEHLLTADFDPHATERELDNLISPRLSESTKANLPKSSKFLPGRVLRKGRVKDFEEPSEDISTKEDLEMYDPDCTSCRLVLNSFDKLMWKQVQQAGEVQLNPKRWGKTAILCTACRSQFQRHHLRCTQCYYVPVIAEDMVGQPGAPKAGGTCSRCKAGTWLREN